MPVREALIIASAEYSDPLLQKLEAPARDAHSFAAVLSDPNIGQFKVTELIDWKSHEIRIAIEKFFSNRTPDDLLLVYFSGHGIKDENGRLFFATTDTQRSLLRATAVPAADLNETMQGSRSRRQVLILDCCFSGAFVRGMTVKAARDAPVGTHDYFQGTGRIVLTASDAMQYAIESDSVTGEGKQSVFTEVIVEGLKTGKADIDVDGKISLNNLYEYVLTSLPTRSPGQKPMMWAFGAYGDMIIAHSKHSIFPPANQLPQWLLDTIADLDYPDMRKGAVEELGKLLKGPNLILAQAAKLRLKELVVDDSLVISKTAQNLLNGEPTVKEQPPVVKSRPTEIPPQRPTPAISQPPRAETKMSPDSGPISGKTSSRPLTFRDKVWPVVFGIVILGFLIRAFFYVNSIQTSVKPVPTPVTWNSADFCPTLQKVVDLAATSKSGTKKGEGGRPFSSLESEKRNPNDFHQESIRSHLYLPGFGPYGCFVKPSGQSYSCGGFMAESEVESLSRKVDSCLNNEWSRNRVRSEHNGNFMTWTSQVSNAKITVADNASATPGISVDVLP